MRDHITLLTFCASLVLGCAVSIDVEKMDGTPANSDAGSAEIEQVANNKQENTDIPCWQDPYTGIWRCPDMEQIYKDLTPGDPDPVGPGTGEKVPGKLPNFKPVPPDPH